ncbi:MAG: hypothetical protein P4L56_17375 [Candidatus Sulfopaludibacter sp.]|nr:hypothetical protein [Candidatus Sulfopaludibacter sp.]
MEIRRELVEYVLVMTLVAVASAFVFRMESGGRRAATPVEQGTQIFGCRLPPGVNPAGTPCRP